MRIAFVGKGGSGKTTISSLFIRLLHEKKQPVFAIDADLNQHLAEAAGMKDPAKAIGLHQSQVKEQLAGTSTFANPEEMIKTTPPSTGSFVATSIFDFANAFPNLISQNETSLIANVGEQQEDDVGIRCYHSKTGVVELLLNHLVEKPEEIVVVDMVAGADAFASGLYDKFDLTVVVVEPTKKSVDVFKQYAGQAKKLGVHVLALGNKVMNQADIDFLENELGEDLIACFGLSSFVRSMERGDFQPISELEPENKQILETVLDRLINCEKDWDDYLKRTIEIHRRNAKSWGNSSKGKDLEDQIDPEFSY